MQTKRCPQCKETKPISEFYKKKKRAKNGKVLYYTPCKKCKTKYCKNWRKKIKVEGRSREIYKQYEENAFNRDPEGFRKKRREKYKRYKERHYEEIREKQRERAAIKRRREGRPVRGPWRKYRDQDMNGQRLDVNPIIKFIEDELEDRFSGNLTHFANYCNMDTTIFRDLLNNKKKYIHESTVDKILTNYGEPYKLYELYPELVQ